MTTRRHFLGAAAALGAAASLRPLRAAEKTEIEPAEEALDILFLGGTGFLGPHQIRYALKRGHRVAMFNRGRNAGLFGDQVEELAGDRDAQVGEGLAALEGDRRWDVVVDNSGYVPRHVRDTAELFRDRCDRYLFVSTVAVYDYDAVEPTDGCHVVDRDGPLLAAPEPTTEEVTGETYGPLKAECDRIVREVYGERAIVVRPCYVVGPGDSTDRFTYWVERLHEGGDVVCPAGPGRAVNWIDARDLCPFTVKLAEDGAAGVFNGVGPASRYTNELLFHGLRAFASAPTTLHWPTAELLDELEYPTPMFDRARSDRATDASAAVAAGLTYRSLAVTAHDLHAWWLAEPEQRRRSVRRWPTPAQERAVLDRLRG